MNRTLVIAVGLLLLASTVMAAPSIVWFSDDFNSATDGSKLKLRAPQWEAYNPGSGAGQELCMYGGQGSGQSVRMKGATSGSYAQTQGDLSATSANKLQVFDFQMKKDANATATSDHAGLYIVDSSHSVIAGWAGGAGRLKNKWTAAGTEGLAYNWADSNWHSFEIIYNPTNGLTRWFIDGALWDTQTLATGKSLAKVYLSDPIANPDPGMTDILWLDNVAVGTTLVPEPSGLLAVSVFGAGMLGYVRRRRA